MKVEGINFGLNGSVEKVGNGVKTDESEAEAAKKREEEVINSLCSFQSRMGPPEHRKWRRVHGLQLPLHPLQVVGWIILLAVGTATFLVLIPALRPFFRECLLVVLATLFTLHVVSHLVALLLDPADPELRALNAKLTIPEFDRTKHAHVIENGRCHLCNIKTSSPKTKHCSVCNKCVDHFDHHCKWLNHCIGGRNYVAFLICVATAVAAALVIVGISVLEIVCYYIDPGSLNAFASHLNETTSGSFLPDSVFLGIIGALGLLAAATSGLLLHLCLFHCYISFLGITTYEYIRNHRQETSAPRISPWTCSCKKGKVFFNRVESTPTNRSNKLKFLTCRYYSWSRPPESEGKKTCCRGSVPFFRSGNSPPGEGKQKSKTLERQNTDPEFVDRVIKPFLITLSDEKNDAEPAGFGSTRSCVRFISEIKHGRCSCGKTTKKEQRTESRVENDRAKNHFTFTGLQFLRPKKILRRHSAGSADKPVKIKSNQVRPSTAEDDRFREKMSAIKTDCRSGGLDFEPFAVMQTKLPPGSYGSLRRLRNADRLRELDSILDLTDRPEFALQLNCKTTRPPNSTTSNYRKMKKNAPRRPRSPFLSPIRESGLSNPGSPRVDIVMPPSPVFVRPPTPEISMIFLSNPNSPSSSDEDDVVSIPTPVIHRHYDSDDILRTPRLPRKVYTAPKEDHIFVLKSTRTRFGKWIDVEIRNYD